MPDLVIRGGRVVDGSGGEPVAADVVVDGDRIVAIGAASGRATRVIDADDAVVAPGFIDLHTHCDFTIHDHPDAPAAVHQGVTTLVAGNCGFSGYPVVDGSLARMAEWCAFLGARPELLAKDARGRFGSLRSLALGPNLIQLVGHGAIRFSVMGDDARPATVGELEAMEAALREALEAGAAGLSSGLIYSPGSFATPEELERLARTVAFHGGIHAIHMRDEGAGVVRAAREAIALAERTGAHVHISHLKTTSRRPGIAAALLSAISGAGERGANLSADQYPYTMSSTKLGAIPSMDGIEPEHVLIATDPSGRYTGRTLAELAADIGEEPMQAVRGLPGPIRDAVQVLLLDRIREEDVRHILASPAVAVASDGWTLAPVPGGNPHPRNFGTFARVLAHYARTLDLISLPVAIHKMTSLPARILGLGDRGRLAPGMVADIVVFDPGAISERATLLDPFALATGMRHVLVAGVPILPGRRVDRSSAGSRPAASTEGLVRLTGSTGFSPYALATLSTPCLVVDLAAIDRNIRRAEAIATAGGIRLRPHFKAHKCTRLMRRQLGSAIAVGATCQTVREAVALADAGITDILVANEVVTEQDLLAVVELTRRAGITVAVDAIAHVALLAAVAPRFADTLDVLIEVDVGAHRCGVQPDSAELLRLAAAIQGVDGLRLRGVLSYEGHAVLKEDRTERERLVGDVGDMNRQVVDRLRTAGHGEMYVTGGGTGTLEIDRGARQPR